MEQEENSLGQVQGESSWVVVMEESSWILELVLLGLLLGLEANNLVGLQLLEVSCLMRKLQGSCLS